MAHSEGESRVQSPFVLLWETVMMPIVPGIQADLVHDAAVTCRHDILMVWVCEQQPSRVDIFPKAALRAVVASRSRAPGPRCPRLFPLGVSLPLRKASSVRAGGMDGPPAPLRWQVLPQGALMDAVPGVLLRKFPWQGKGAASCCRHHCQGSVHPFPASQGRTVILGAPWCVSPCLFGADSNPALDRYPSRQGQTVLIITE